MQKKLIMRHGFAAPDNSGRRMAEYDAWRSMKQRCYNPNHSEYPHYGARGIAVCPQWKNNFASFFAHVGPRPSPDHSLDRIDNERGYEPGNIRWALLVEQNRNKRTNKLLTIRGITKTQAEWCSWVGMIQATLQKRLASGLSPETALTRPPEFHSGKTHRLLMPLFRPPLFG